MTSALPFAREIGWVLLHSLWQGALVGSLAAVALGTARRAEARYAIACAGMLALACAPLATLAFWPAPSPIASAGFEAPSPVSGATEPRALDAWLELAAALWLAGALVAQARLALHALRAERWRRLGVAPAPLELERALRELCRELDLRAGVRIAASTRASVPAVVGCFAPIVLVPARALTGLSANELRAVLAHELAHVKRHDALANLLQSLFEALFFFHPAAWWLSARARVEREYCCDDLAVRASGDALGFARALARLESLRGEPAALALRSTGGPLMQRIQRLIAPHEAPRGRSPFRGLATAAAAALLGASALALTSTSQWRRAAPQDGGSARQESPDELEARILELRSRIDELKQRIDELREERRAGGEDSLPRRRRTDAAPEAPRSWRRLPAPPGSEAPVAPDAPRGRGFSATPGFPTAPPQGEGLPRRVWRAPSGGGQGGGPAGPSSGFGPSEGWGGGSADGGESGQAPGFGRGGAFGRSPAAPPTPAPPTAPSPRLRWRIPGGGGAGVQTAPPAPQVEAPAPESSEQAPRARRRWKLEESPDGSMRLRAHRMPPPGSPAPSSPGAPGAVPEPSPLPLPQTGPEAAPLSAPPAAPTPRARVRWRRVPSGTESAPEVPKPPAAGRPSEAPAAGALPRES